LEFSASWTAAGNGNGMDSAIVYAVSTISGAATLTGTGFGMTDSITSGSLTVDYSETMCLGEIVTGLHQCPTTDELLLQIQGDSPDGYRQTSGVFAPVSQITVLDDVFIKSLDPDGNGEILNGNNIFPNTPTPEPATCLLGISGLLVLWQMGRAARRRKN